MLNSILAGMENIAMNEGAKYILFVVLRSIFYGTQMSDEDKHFFTKETLADVTKLASKYDIARLVVLGLLDNDLLMMQLKYSSNKLLFIQFIVMKTEL